MNFGSSPGRDDADTVSAGERLSRHLTEVRYMFSTHLRHRIVTGPDRGSADDRCRQSSQSATPTRPSIGPARLEVAATALKPAIRLEPDRRDHVPDEPAAEVRAQQDSFGQPRPDGRIHEGIDIMASLGQEVYAVDNGVLHRADRSTASQLDAVGQRLVLTMPDKTYYFLPTCRRSLPAWQLGRRRDPWAS